MESLKTLQLNKVSGSTGISIKTLREWHAAAQPTVDEDGDELVKTTVELWGKVLEIVRIEFVEGIIPKAFSTSILVLIPKSTPGKFRGIALLESIYKLISSIINRRLALAIKFDDALHGFCKSRGTGWQCWKSNCWPSFAVGWINISSWSSWT